MLRNNSHIDVLMSHTEDSSLSLSLSRDNLATVRSHKLALRNSACYTFERNAIKSKSARAHDMTGTFHMTFAEGNHGL